MKFNPKKLVKLLSDHNGRDNDESFQSDVFDEIADEDYPLAAQQVRQCRIPVGMRAIDHLLAGDDAGVVDLHRVWRYHAYPCFVDQAEADWIRNQIEHGKQPEFDIPSMSMGDAAYALAGGITFEEDDFTHWLGKRALAAFMKPDVFGPVFGEDEPIVPYVLGLFVFWAGMKSGGLPENTSRLIGQLAKQTGEPYEAGLLQEWDAPSFDKHFKNLCDNWGDRHAEPLPFYVLPLAIVATIKIRKALNLSVPKHPLLEHTVVSLPLSAGRIRSEDDFFERVNKQIAAIAPTNDFLWCW